MLKNNHPTNKSQRRLRTSVILAATRLLSYVTLLIHAVADFTDDCVWRLIDRADLTTTHDDEETWS
ncbi:MAG: hypothetical protein ACPGVU_04075 [Limisphaerales bacterium]